MLDAMNQGAPKNVKKVLDATGLICLTYNQSQIWICGLELQHKHRKLNMKTTLRNSLAGWVTTAALIVALPALATKAPQVEAMKKSLKSVPVLEMPAKAAQMVIEAKPNERESVVVAVIVAAAQVRPTALAAVVGAVVSVAPELAATITSTAVKLQPKQAVALTQAATMAAPGQADKIAKVVTQAVPSQQTVAPLAGPPAVGPAFTEVPSSPTAINRDNTVVVPPGGGRDYSSP